MSTHKAISSAFDDVNDFKNLDEGIQDLRLALAGLDVRFDYAVKHVKRWCSRANSKRMFGFVC